MPRRYQAQCSAASWTPLWALIQRRNLACPGHRTLWKDMVSSQPMCAYVPDTAHVECAWTTSGRCPTHLLPIAIQPGVSWTWPSWRCQIQANKQLFGASDGGHVFNTTCQHPNWAKRSCLSWRRHKAEAKHSTIVNGHHELCGWIIYQNRWWQVHRGAASSHCKPRGQGLSHSKQIMWVCTVNEARTGWAFSRLFKQLLHPWRQSLGKMTDCWN